MKRNAGFVYDLRHAWPSVCWMTARGAGAAGEGESGEGSPASPPPAENEGQDDDTDTGSEGGEHDDDVRNPEIKKLHDEAAKYRNAAKAERDRAEKVAAELNKANEALRNAKVENAFLHAAHGRVDDTDAAWKLVDKAGLTVGDDGAVTGADEAVANVLERYPYLRPETPDLYSGGVPPTEPSGRMTNGPRNDTSASTAAVLQKKFPALRGRN